MQVNFPKGTIINFLGQVKHFCLPYLLMCNVINGLLKLISFYVPMTMNLLLVQVGGKCVCMFPSSDLELFDAGPMDCGLILI